jgi:small subunit ribosomal protein S9
MTTLASELNPKAQTEEQTTTRPLREAVPPDAHGWWWGTGRRKTAVARCRARVAKDGDGKGTVQIQVNRKQYKGVEDYFSEEQDRNDVYAPLKLNDLYGKLDVILRIRGGGTTGQAQAARLAIARALVGYDPTTENALRDAGYLTRDSRKVERKKYGQPGARRRFQFSKR